MNNNFVKLSDLANHPSLRLSQSRAVAAAIPRISAIIKGETSEDRLYAIHPPASGKSFVPLLILAIFRKLGVPAKLCYVASSEALVTQFCADALKPFVNDIIGFNPQIHASTNAINPSRGLDGYATTYQALVADRSGINRHEFTNYAYVLVGDEYHHVCEGGVFHSAIQPLEERSLFNISMTGTDERSDGRPIANFPYMDIGNGFSRLDYSGKCYSRTTLSEEKSEGNIIDTSIHAYDARCEYSEDGGQVFEESLASIQDATRCRKAIRTAIRTDTRDFIRSSGLRMFEQDRESLDYPEAQAIIICESQLAAHSEVKHVKELGFTCRVAVSGDGETANKNIRDFRNGAFEVLVCVGKAHEGMDNPRIISVIFLTAIRALVHAIQSWGRGARRDLNGPLTQINRVHVTDDQLCRDLIDRIGDEDTQVVIEDTAESTESSGLKGSSIVRSEIIPLRSEVSNFREIDLLTGTNLAVSRVLTSVQEVVGNLTEEQSEQLTKLLGSREIASEQIPMTPSEIASRYRSEIEAQVRKLAHQRDISPEIINRSLKIKFGKPRALMDNDELMRVHTFVTTINASYLENDRVPEDIEEWEEDDDCPF